MRQWKSLTLTSVFLLLFSPAVYAVEGDVNGIKGVELGDAITALQIVSGMQPDTVQLADVNGDNHIGTEEAVFVLQFVATLRLITYTNSLGMTFSYIPSGSFVMGSPVGELGRSVDETQHEVILSKAFFMQTTEVTQKQWKDVMGTSPSSFSTCGENCPVENVSWDNAQSFITALNQLGNGTYRLPTEAEWEYAARAGSTTAFANGQITQTGDSPLALDPNLDLMGWYKGNADGSLHPVATKQANRWGLYDMHGNVWEWCEDWYDESYTGGPTNGSARAMSIGTYRVSRGGCWFSGGFRCRSAVRFWSFPDFRNDGLGFRFARTP